jgi:hypothetical protein
VSYHWPEIDKHVTLGVPDYFLMHWVTFYEEVMFSFSSRISELKLFALKGLSHQFEFG